LLDIVSLLFLGFVFGFVVILAAGGEEEDEGRFMRRELDVAEIDSASQRAEPETRTRQSSTTNNKGSTIALACLLASLTACI
jgi:hypothetical protein